MRLICVPSLFILISLIAHITHAIDFTEENSLQQQQYQQSVSDESNLDDTSLFRGVENAIDEDTEDDAYRIFKSLQDVSEDDFSDEDEEEVNQIEHSTSREIKSRIQPEEEEEGDDEVDMEDDENEDDEEEDEEEEEDEDEDFSLGSFPDFKNDATADFFEHLQQNPSSVEDEKDKEGEEDIEEDNIENHIDIHDVEEDYNEEEDVVDNKPINTNNNNNNNNNIPIPVVLPPSPPLLPLSNEENTIPWQRPDSKDRLVVNEIDNKFNQDSNYNSSFQHKQKSTAGFRFWHGVFVLLILVIIFKSSNRKKAHHLLDSNNSTLPWSKDEKDYLPVSF
ncbi:unnamed protein product [Mucor hiemalis]